MIVKIKLMADYGAILWREGEPGGGEILPEELPLSPTTTELLYAWMDKFDTTYNQDDPENSGFKDRAEQQAFDLEGVALWELLVQELPENYQITYHSSVLNQFFTNAEKVQASQKGKPVFSSQAEVLEFLGDFLFLYTSKNQPYAQQLSEYVQQNADYAQIVREMFEWVKSGKLDEVRLVAIINKAGPVTVRNLSEAHDYLAKLEQLLS